MRSEPFEFYRSNVLPAEAMLATGKPVLAEPWHIGFGVVRGPSWSEDNFGYDGSGNKVSKEEFHMGYSGIPP
eukprot:7156887-Pyramimonas_sp.AAC.1